MAPIADPAKPISSTRPLPPTHGTPLTAEELELMALIDERAELLRQVESLHWAHSIDLGDGIVTPGHWARNPLIWRALDDVDFRGKKVLDIGCWDGLYAFEAEKRGAAEVYATDCLDQRTCGEFPTFQLAHKTLKSKVKYFPNISVFDIASLDIRDFDIVLFCGVYYHLRHPQLAIDRVRQVIKPGGLMIFEGDATMNEEEPVARFFYSQIMDGDVSNWYSASVPCLRDWVTSSFFNIKHEYAAARYEPWTPPTPRERWTKLMNQMLGKRWDVRLRYVITAEAVNRQDQKYRYPDAELREFDQNNYA